MNYLIELILKLAKVDRRWIFLTIGLVVLIPLLYPLALPIRPGKDSQQVYDFVEALDDSSKVLLSCEYGPSTKPEIHPMVTSLLHHLFSLNKGHKVYVVCLWPDGQFMAEEALDEVAVERFGLTYGEDFVMLGFRPGAEAVVKGIVSDLRKLYTIDAKGTKIEKNKIRSDLTVKDIKICKSIYKRTPVGSDVVFTNTVDSLYCYSRIQNPGSKAEVKHVWYYENKVMTQVIYNVKKSNIYRSWTKKTILPSQVGKWRVDILDSYGTIIGSKKFKITKF